MEKIDSQKKKLNEEELAIVIQKSSEYVNVALTAFNAILAKAKDEGNDPYLEATSVMQALSMITMSIITSLSGEKEKSCILLTDHIDYLDSILMQMEESPSEDSYKATEEVSPQAITETNEEWLARQRTNEHDVTCCEPNDSKP